MTLYPVIEEAVTYSRELDKLSSKADRRMIICFIISNGSVTCPVIDNDAIIDACAYPICFVTVTVGEHRDDFFVNLDNMRYRKFDNFNYSHLNDIKGNLERQRQYQMA